MTPELIEGIKNDICGAYLIIDVYEPRSPRALTGINIDYIDGMGDVHIENGLMSLADELWIDLWDPEYDFEYDFQWPDPECCPLPEDAWFEYEELVHAVNIDQILASDPEAVRVRITDRRLNWKRSANVLEVTENDPTILDLMFYDDNMYPDEICYQYEGLPDRRVECDGYVMDRPGGEAPLDVCLVVSSYSPPESLTVKVGAPLDTPNQDEVWIELYRLSDTCADWLKIWSDVFCAGKIDDDCVEIYCRYKEGRSFCNCPADPPMLIASDSETTTPSSPENPVDYSRPPYLFVSSDDSLMLGSSPGDDYKDWAVAVASAQDFGDNSWIRNNWEAPMSFHYGSAFRGWFENGVEAGGEVFLNMGGACSGLSDSYHNFNRNVLSFGFEPIWAECEESWASYPIQSEADIMLVHCHGDVKITPGPHQWDSYMYFFAESSSSPFQPEPTPETVIYSNEWATYIGRDADWLATTACWLLAEDYEDENKVKYPGVCAWQDWQNLVTQTSLQSVLGWKEPHTADFDPTNPAPPAWWPGMFSSDAPFWSQFAAHLNEDGYLPHAERWVNQDVSDEHGVICYMEAAWEYYNGALDEWIGEQPGWQGEYKSYMLGASAVDGGSRYILKEFDDPALPYEVLIVKL